MDRSTQKEREFKQFDIVGDYSDHHFADKIGNTGTAAKKIMREWKILEENLPKSIYVRVYEGRIDLLRAAIVGASGTPYHDGLFFFDLLFPSDYPAQPPLVHYRSYGLRINPNLYSDGDVCLSLLNTWVGKKDERWNSSESTVLQILLSIQALVLNEKPMFNEPGYENFLGTSSRNKKSLIYNQTAFSLSCKTMLFVLSNMPKHFEDLVTAHFSERAQVILMASKAYINGLANIGSIVKNGSLSSSAANFTERKRFKMVMKKLYPELVLAFRRINGAPPLEEKKRGFTSRIFNILKKLLGLSRKQKPILTKARLID